MRNKPFVTAVALAALTALVAVDGFAQLVVPSVTFTSNVAGAQIIVDGDSRGRTPVTLRLRPGRYAVRVTAPNQNPISRQIQVSNAGNQTFTFDFQQQRPQRTRPPALHEVTIGANVSGADVMIDGDRQGQTPLTARLASGSYRLQLSANGYDTFVTTLAVSDAARQSFSFALQPSIAYLNVDLPDRLVSTRGGDRAAARRQVTVYIDGDRSDRLTGIEVRPGAHSITVETGGFSVTRQLDFRPGQTYNVRLVAELEVTPG